MARPFGTDEAMFDRAREIAHAMPLDEQVELIDAHPRLGAPAASVSALSYGEQGYDAMSDADAESEAQRRRLATELERLNVAYEARFGFRYCVFVAGRERAELLPGMAAALEADRDAEITRALDAVIDIAHARYATLTADPAEEPA
jgi:2-oxo-4-hydroxy-4-carboxy-5-ureidoimidazoline decarboxylase